jgi:hypothetical protein
MNKKDNLKKISSHVSRRYEDKKYVGYWLMLA